MPVTPALGPWELGQARTGGRPGWPGVGSTFSQGPAGCRGEFVAMNTPSCWTDEAGIQGGSAWALAPGHRDSWNQAQPGVGGGGGQGWLRELKVVGAPIPPPQPLCIPRLLPAEEERGLRLPWPGGGLVDRISALLGKHGVRSLLQPQGRPGQDLGPDKGSWETSC